MDDKKEHFFAEHLIDLAGRACREDYPVFTDFMTTGEYRILEEKRKQIHGVKIICWGGHEDCDHMMGGFFPEQYTAMAKELFPIACIHIEAADSRYAELLSHRDYLGAILNLGIDRSTIGDIRISEQTAYVFCKVDFASFILDNIITVKHTPVQCRILENTEKIPPQRYEERFDSVASLRLDNVVSAMIGSARGRAAALIRQGSVIADHRERTAVSFICKDNMIITIRGYGRFRLMVPDGSLTRKGKQKIIIYKYM